LSFIGIFDKKDREMQIYKADETFGGEGIVVRREVANRIKEAHLHEFIEIIFIRSGEGVESVGGVDYSVRRGDMIFVNFGKTHAFSGRGMEFIHILLRPEFMSERLVNSDNIFDIFSLPAFSSIEGECTLDDVVSFSGAELVSVTNLVDAMLSEYENKRAGWRTALYGYAQVLFTLLVRRLKDAGESSNLSVSKIESYVAEHLFDKITLSDIAENCFYNPSYFSRKFKSVFGKKLTDYVREKRLLAAAKMLAETDKSNGEIALLCGFSDKTQFYKLFRAEFGCTPTEYRKK
jgi:AraC-like DNA-binding protein/mannose-6-phosphate isomerase-like protein (cupin superfamily)